MKKTVACVIVNYNDWKRTLALTKTIEGYDHITYVIVVDNCSADDSRTHLNAHSGVKYVYVESPKNGGYGYGNNVGIRKAAELGVDCVLIANPDIEFDDDCLAHMLETMNTTPNCAVVGARETNLGVYGWRYTSTLHDILSASIVLNKLLKKRYYPQNYFEGKNKVPVDVIPGCFLLVDLAVMLRHGMYDEEFFLYEEEKVIYHKLSTAGYSSYVDLEVSFQHWHVDGTPTVSKLLTTKKRLLNSKMLFLEKYRKVSGAMRLFAKVFFALTMAEMALYAKVLSWKERSNDR